MGSFGLGVAVVGWTPGLARVVLTQTPTLTLTVARVVHGALLVESNARLCEPHSHPKQRARNNPLANTTQALERARGPGRNAFALLRPRLSVSKSFLACKTTTVIQSHGDPLTCARALRGGALPHPRKGPYWWPPRHHSLREGSRTSGEGRRVVN